MENHFKNGTRSPVAMIGSGQRFGQERSNLLVGRLRKIVVPEAHRVERLWLHEADNLLGGIRDGPTAVWCSHRHRDDDTCGCKAVRRLYCGSHARSGCEAVVHEDGDPAGDRDWLPIATIGELTTSQFVPFERGDPLDLTSRWTVPGHDVIVQDAHAAAGNRTHRKFGMTGCAQLANDEDVERAVQRPRHYEGNRHSASR